MKATDTRDWTDPLGYQHRYETARRLGLTEPLAREFAESKIALWQLRELIERGCEPSLALDILS